MKAVAQRPFALNIYRYLFGTNRLGPYFMHSQCCVRSNHSRNYSELPQANELVHVAKSSYVDSFFYLEQSSANLPKLGAREPMSILYLWYTRRMWYLLVWLSLSTAIFINPTVENVISPK